MRHEQIPATDRDRGDRMNAFDARNRPLSCLCAQFVPLRAHLPCRWPQSAHAYEVVSSGNDVGVNAHALQAARHRAAQPTVGLHPAEDLLDTLSLPLADCVALMARGARIEARGVAPF